MHSDCDGSLTQTSVDLLTSDSHPGVCYQCTHCRSTETENRGNQLEERLTTLEAQLNKLQQQVHPVIRNLVGETDCGTHPVQQMHTNMSQTALRSAKNSPKIMQDRAEMVPKSFAEAVRNGRTADNSVYTSVFLDATEAPRSQHTEILLPKRNTVNQLNINSQAHVIKPVAKHSPPLAVICTNIYESNDTLLLNRQTHDTSEWLKLCKLIGLDPIQPKLLSRISRHPDSPHSGKPRLLKISLNSEKELEDVLLSAYILNKEGHTTSRIYADVPWWERRNAKTKEKAKEAIQERSVVLLGIPDVTNVSCLNQSRSHDIQQWKFIEGVLGLKEVALVDTFRIPRSPRYSGTGPRPLKLTFLTSDMANVVRTQCLKSRNLLLPDIRVSTMKPKIITPEQQPNESDNKTKNDCQPTLLESAV